MPAACKLVWEPGHPGFPLSTLNKCTLIEEKDLFFFFNGGCLFILFLLRPGRRWSCPLTCLQLAGGNFWGSVLSFAKQRITLPISISSSLSAPFVTGVLHHAGYVKPLPGTPAPRPSGAHGPSLFSSWLTMAFYQNSC